MLSAHRRSATARLAKFGLAVTLFALAACGGSAQQTGIVLAQDAAVAIQRNLSAADIAALKDTCIAAAPALTAATAAGLPASLKETAVYPYAFCKEILAGQQNHADRTSVAWLAKVLAVTQDVASAANIILPVALKLLPLVAAVL